MGATTKYEKAKKVADEIDDNIISVLKSGKNFCVEAGAGTGKTYSLLKVLSWIEENRSDYLKITGKSVACITYTNVAVEEIANRLSANSSIVPSTIHSFAWDLIKDFQKDLIKSLSHIDLSKKYNEEEINSINNVNYTLGVRYIESSILYLSHDDVITLFSLFLDNKKFRFLISNRYPLILIDEYQDSSKSIMDQFLNYFIERTEGPQIGLFGDSWQTIYSLGQVCGEIVSDNIILIKKKSNFRSQEIIVDVLNKIRPNLTQISAIDDNNGKVIVILTNDYRGIRENSGYYKGELPEKILNEYINKVIIKLESMGWSNDNGEIRKVFMLTHKLLSKQQGYSNLLEILDDGLKEMTDPHLLFFNNYVEPVYRSLKENNTALLYDTLRIRRPPLTSRSKKTIWKKFFLSLEKARNSTIYDVLKCIKDSKLIPIPENISLLIDDYKKENTDILIDGVSKEVITKPVDLYSIKYKEVVKALKFFNENSLYATNHGVKGTEFDNVIMVMGRGWNNYRFEDILYKNKKYLIEKDLKAYIRNRNLFYVGCSRAKKRLAIFITIPVNEHFCTYLENIFGKENIYNFYDFINN
ncbi:MAG TPA: ATP-dependent helicase [Clostridiaceae bacterium]|nr:ATP-dependent helicase [Clostridiaceae bacterium]